MRMKFWSDTNQQGFLGLLAEKGVEVAPVNNYEFEIPEELRELAEDWGATETLYDN